MIYDVNDRFFKIKMVYQRLQAKYVTNPFKKLMNTKISIHPKCGQSMPVASLVEYYVLCLITWTIDSGFDFQNSIEALGVGCLILDFIYLPDVECGVVKLNDKPIGIAKSISPKFYFISKLRVEIKGFKNVSKNLSLPNYRKKIAKKQLKIERFLYQFIDDVCSCKQDEVNEGSNFWAVDKKLVILDKKKKEELKNIENLEVKYYRHCDACDACMISWNGCPCKQSWYCSRKCQKKHWKNEHEKICTFNKI